ncbi:MAG: hypothetical protein KJ666_03445 [Bacteroidetes bacterium]|nr:hypothetical protein [Bacteroidota bacterium]MBU2586025.1 hypothetical protein [Bacteroidota bacterium]
MKSLLSNTKFRISFAIIAGSAIGFAYYYFIGCYSGTCPITSTWYISTIYGGVAGLLIGLPSKKK